MSTTIENQAAAVVIKPATRETLIRNLKRLRRKRENWGIDYDYLHQLSLAELQFLTHFTAVHYEGPGTERRKRQNDATTLVNVCREPVRSQLTPATAEDVLEIQEEIRMKNKSSSTVRKRAVNVQV